MIELIQAKELMLLKVITILMTCVIKDDGKFYLQIFLEEALLEAEVLAAAFYSLNSTIKLG